MTTPIDLGQFEGHTEGPWSAAAYSKKRFGLGRPISHGGGGAFFLLQCVNDDTESPAAIADARLIAAAPELLAYAKRLEEAMERIANITAGAPEDEDERMVASIARKALGEAPAP